MAKDKHLDIQYNREYVKMNDGGQVSVDWYNFSGHNPDNNLLKVCMVFPGLTDSSDIGYAKATV